MSADRELLKLAAKAAGISKQWDGSFVSREAPDHVWSPLTNDGDRHRLLVGLKMTLAHEPSRGGWSVGAVVAGEFRWLAFHEDEARAVVKAAAAIGRVMP